MKEKEKKNQKPSVRAFDSFKFVFYFIFFSFSFDVGPTCPFIILFNPFQPRNNLFCPGFNFLYSN